MKGGVGDADYLAAWDLVLGPIARAFAPQVQPVSRACVSGCAGLRWRQQPLLPPLQWWCA